MSRGVRRLALTAHVTASVGWFGGVVAFLALALAGLISQDAELVRAAYQAMALIGWVVIVPLALASLLTGIIQSLGTAWGLFRQWWVVAKLVITVPATILVVVHMQPISHVAGVAAEGALSPTDLSDLRIQFVAQAVAALVVLLVATVLSVYKPRGRTPYGRRKHREQRAPSLP
jgi:DMSO/TMAO reductase YedYZ heme-binding membrane subunit